MILEVLLVLAGSSETPARASTSTPSAGLYFEQTTVVVPQGGAAGAGVRSRVWHSVEGAQSERG